MKAVLSPPLGFEIFGAMALALYSALANVGFHGGSLVRFLLPFIGLLEKIIGRGRPFVFIPMLCFGTVVMLGWPQMAFALIGGFISRRFSVTITRRWHATSGQIPGFLLNGSSRSEMQRIERLDLRRFVGVIAGLHS
jgi:hypothetical protein